MKDFYQERIEEIDQELEEIKEAVIQYAKKNDIEIVTGSDHQLKIKLNQKIKVPVKGTQEREPLIALLNQRKKSKEVKGFDINEFKKVIKEKKWDINILEQIKDFLMIETTMSVRLSLMKKKK